MSSASASSASVPRGRAIPAGRVDPSEGPDQATERQCSRCRRYFDGTEPNLDPHGWWLCEPCHVSLFSPPR